MTSETDPDKWSGEDVFVASSVAVVIAAMSIISNYDLRPPLQQVSVELAKEEAFRDPLDLLGPQRAGSPIGPTSGTDEPPPGPAVDGSRAGSTRQTSSDIDEFPASGEKSLPVLDIDFSLTGPVRPAGALPKSDASPFKVRKKLYVEGRLVGDIDVVVDGDGQLFLETEQLASIARKENQTGKPQQFRLTGEGLATFAQLREVGLDLRYSPSNDAIVLNP